MSSTSPYVRIAFYGPTLYEGARYTLSTAFTDNTYFTWDPTQPVANSQWSGLFCDPIVSIPDNHLQAEVMNNNETYTWAFYSISGSTPNTVQLPTGTLPLGTLLEAIHSATQQVVSDEQYRDVVGEVYSGNGQPTLAQALQTQANSMGASTRFTGVFQESPTVLRIQCW